MKIGIITFHHTTNYGATLQAYALLKTIENQGYEVEIIDYRPQIAVRAYRGEILNILAKKRKLVKLETLTTLAKVVMKHLKMRIFMLFQMKLSKKTFHTIDDLNNFNFDYDVVITGSDQVWCINSFRGFDASFFLKFINNKKCCKVSYAASFSTTNNLGDTKTLICKLLSDFNAISVRDQHSLQLINQECNILATKVLDPTFLINFDDIEIIPKIAKDYLLVYHHGIMEDYQQNFIKAIAETKGLAIISITNLINLTNINLTNIDPKEWVGYFHKASYVVTNTYHGTIFSIKFKKNFTVYGHPEKMNKINDLLEKFGLESRFLNKQEDSLVGEHLKEINYDLIEKQLQIEIFKSKNFLYKAINNEETDKDTSKCANC